MVPEDLETEAMTGVVAVVLQGSTWQRSSVLNVTGWATLLGTALPSPALKGLHAEEVGPQYAEIDPRPRLGDEADLPQKSPYLDLDLDLGPMTEMPRSDPALDTLQQHDCCVVIGG